MNVIKRYKNSDRSPADNLVLGYILIMGLLLIPFHNQVKYWSFFMIGHLLIAWGLTEAICFMSGHPSKWSQMIHSLYPIAFIFLSWMELKYLITMIFPDYYGTSLIIKFEELLFGDSPTLMIQQWFRFTWLTEFMHAIYASYYLLYPGAIIFLFWKNEKPIAENLIFILCLNHIIYFSIFLLFPVEGPKTAMDSAANAALKGDFFLHLISSIQQTASIKGAAFPSLHVAESFLISWIILKKWTRLGILLLLFSMTMSVATVYCQYHYAVDAIAAFMLSYPVYAFGKYIFHRKKQPAVRIDKY